MVPVKTCVAFVTTGLGAISNDCPGRKDSRRGVAVGNLTGPWLEVQGRELGGDGSPEPARKLELELQTCWTARAWPLSAPFGVPAAGGQPCRPRTSVGSWRFGTKQSFVDGSGVGKAKTISSQCRMPCGEQQRLRTRDNSRHRWTVPRLVCETETGVPRRKQYSSSNCKLPAIPSTRTSR